MVKLALTTMRKIECEKYIFPDDYFDIPGIKGFEDLETVRKYALGQMEEYVGKNVEVYLNGGMVVEILSVLQAADELDIGMDILHYNKTEGIYVPQKVSWRSRKGMDERKGVMLDLCKGRHGSQGDRAVFDMIPEGRLFDFEWQKCHAFHVLSGYMDKRIFVYVSGLTSLCISILNAAGCLQVPVTFLHYNYNTEEYFPQVMDK